MFGDKEFRRYFDQRWGIDLLGNQVREKAFFASLDDYYFFDERLRRRSLEFYSVVD